ncbi:TraK family protein [Methylomonas sp. HYX-M1]|uniref:TraK family protein n=1 Tax=Methylomonas sp. HYX-M1 TaxID=3139307 RepID=UPI00345C2482
MNENLSGKASEKPLSECLADWVLQNKQNARGYNRALFMRLRDEIKQALDDGWTVAQIYRLLYEEGKVPFSYQAFRLYANSLILNPGQTRRQAKGDKPETPQAEKPEPAAKQAADKVKGFVWNPNPNKEDLV